MDETIRSNRDVWDAWTKIHVGSEFYDVASFKNGERPIRIADYEREEVGSVEGKTLLHLQCHFGLDTLSWARLGATVTGLDFSAAAIEAARTLAAEVGIPATFVQSDVYSAAEVLDEQFDIVYTSSGVLGWLPDIVGWARVAVHFVRPGGFLYITEIHPVALVWEDEGVEPGELRLRYRTGRMRIQSGSRCRAHTPTARRRPRASSSTAGITRSARSSPRSRTRGCGSSSSTSSTSSAGRSSSWPRARTADFGCPKGRRASSRSSFR